VHVGHSEPFDAALHDVFGKLHALSSYRTYGRDFMAHDLSHYLGPEFKGQYLDQYLLMEPSARLALYHSVEPPMQSKTRMSENRWTTAYPRPCLVGFCTTV